MLPIYEWERLPGRASLSGTVYIVDEQCRVDQGCSKGASCPPCQAPAEGVEVFFPGLAGILDDQGNQIDQTAITDSNGRYEFPVAPEGIYDVQTTVFENQVAFHGEVEVTLADGQSKTDANIFVNVLQDETDREVTIKGEIELIDCDRGSSYETRKYNPTLTCHVSPDQPTDSVEMLPMELCADEVGLHFWGTCDFEWIDMAAGTHQVRVTLNAQLDEQVSGTCGGGEGEDHWKNRSFVVGKDAVVRPSLSRLKNDGWCYYGVWASQCDDKSFFRDFSISNRRRP